MNNLFHNSILKTIWRHEQDTKKNLSKIHTSRTVLCEFIEFCIVSKLKIRLHIKMEEKLLWFNDK